MKNAPEIDVKLPTVKEDFQFCRVPKGAMISTKKLYVEEFLMKKKNDQTKRYFVWKTFLNLTNDYLEKDFLLKFRKTLERALRGFEDSLEINCKLKGRNKMYRVN